MPTSDQAIRLQSWPRACSGVNL